MSLKKKILITMVCIVFSISLLLGLAILQQSEVVVKNFENKIIDLNAQNSVVLLQEVFDNTRTSLAQMINSTNLYDLTECDAEASIDSQESSEILTARLRNFLSDSFLYGNSSLTFVNVYLENGVNSSTISGDALPFSDFETVCDYLDRKGILARDEYKGLVWLDSVRIRNVNALETDCFVCVRFLYNRVTMERIGAIVAGVDTDDLNRLFQNAFPNAFIINQRGCIVSSDLSSNEIKALQDAFLPVVASMNNSNGNTSYYLNGEQRSALYWKVANNCAYFVIPLRAENLVQNEVAKSFLINLLITIVVAILIAGIISLFSAEMLTNGLEKLTKIVKQVANGNRDKRFQPKKHDEVAYLGIQFNNMLDELERKYEADRFYQEEKQQLELSLLQSKINPHLLYNTLDIAVWSIKSNDSQKAIELIYALSRFFKQTLANGRELISLKEELDIIESYISLQCLAGNKEYQVRVQIDPRIQSFLIPHLLLQPIVENSVRHGFKDFLDDGTVKITASLSDDGDLVEIQIMDNGIGIIPEEVLRINQMLHEQLHQEHEKSYGLMNTARRVRYFYGEQYYINISSEVGEYTKV